MARVCSYQRSFNGGEVSPSMYSRIDDGKYQTGLALCRNFLVEPQGPIVNRPGFMYVNHVKDASKPPVLIPFQFSNEQTWVLEFGHKYVRFHTDGQTLMSGGVPYEVATPYEYGDLQDIHYVQSADIVTLCHPKYEPQELKRYGPYDWRIAAINLSTSLGVPQNVSAVQTINANVSNKTDYVREYAVTALLDDGTQESERSNSATVNCNPYGDGAYNTITWSKVDGAGLYRIYRNQGGIWSFIGQTSGTSIRDENIDPDASITPPLYDDPFSQKGGITSVTVTNGGSGYATLGGVSGIAPGTLWHYPGRTNNRPDTYSNSVPPYSDFVRVYPAYLSRVQNIGVSSSTGSGASVSFALKSIPPSGNINIETWSIAGVIVNNAGSGYKAGDTWSGGYLDGNNIKTGIRWSYPITIARRLPRVYVTDPTGTGCELEADVDNNGVITSIRVVRPGKGYTNPKVVIDPNGGGGSGATATATFGKSGDFPGAVSYFEGRRWFGGTYNRPNWLWATKSGTDYNMGYSLPSQDDDRIAAAVVSRNADRIEHIVPLSRLIFLTAAAEWLATTKNSDTITQASLSVNTQAYFGANNVQPVIVGSSVVYAASRGGHLRECGYSYEAGGYITNDVCLRAPHLFDNKSVTGMAFGKAPFPTIWCLSSDGRIIALTYVPEQQVGAFSTIETDGRFLSLCVVPEGDEDVLYAVVERSVAGQKKVFVERMHERQFKTLEDCVYLDCSGTYRGEPKSVISGLTWLEGQEVSIFADGSCEPNRVVKNGQIELDAPASVVTVGIPYTCDAQTLPFALALQDGSYGNGHKKNVKTMIFRVVNSSGLQAGPSFDRLTEYPARSIEFAGSPPSVITDEIEVRVGGAWGNTGQCCIRQPNPLPAKIISMTTEIELA